ncbi:MAG: hybrid sensor histidine kinase/response regulator [Oceanipulchritudo sp.]
MKEKSHKPGVILIVEDSRINRRSLERLLADSGWEVLSAASGAEALELYRRRQPDVILMDVLMPEMDGFETCRLIREDPSGKHVPVLFMTGLNDTRSKLKGFALGGADYIPKPYEEAELLARLEAQLKIVQLRRELTEEIIAKDRAIVELEAFSHTVAHDLKNPLSAMISLAEDLRGSEVEEGTTSMLLEAGQQCYRIIDEILVLASVRSEEVKVSRVDMLVGLKRVVDTLGWLCSEKRAVIEVPDSLPEAIGRASWIGQVWMNFLSNAVHHGGDSPRVRIGGEVRGHRARYWVEDNGPGIPDALKEHLFAPFSRLDDVSTTGNGLGLSIVRRIADRLEGTVGVEDADGGGSRFFLELPAAEPGQLNGKFTV